MYTLSQGKLLENHTLHRSTSYMAHIWQYPLPPPINLGRAYKAFE